MSEQAGVTTPGLPIDESRPIPPRYWWLKRLSIVTGMLLIFLVGLRLWWGREADRRLQAEMDSYIAAGQPVYTTDFEAELARVPDDQNAALLLEESVRVMLFTSNDAYHFRTIIDNPQLVFDQPDAINEILRINRPALDLVRKARSKSKVAWTWPVASNAMPMNLSLHRELAKLQRLAAANAYHQGDHAEMLELMLDGLSHARSISAHPSLICNLVGIACEALVVRSIEYFGADLSLDRQAGQDGSATARHATESQMRYLIELLLDEESAGNSAIRTFYVERANSLNLNFMKMLMAGSGGGMSPFGYVMDAIAGPLLRLDVLRGIRCQTDAARIVQEGTWDGHSIACPEYSPPHSLLFLATRPLSIMMQPSYCRFVILYFRHIAMRRMGALALAIRLYQVDHGYRPVELAQLVPAYLPSVPSDPFGAVGSDIRYKPDAEYPILYSIGADGTDNGGIGPREPDLVFYLDGPPKDQKEESDQPSTETGEDDQNAENDERQSE